MATVNVGKNVPDSAFQGQTTITSVNFGSNCTVVGKNAFEGCISLSAINDNNKIKTIGAGAFAGTAINEAKFSYLNTFTKILSSNYYGAFQSCSQLTYVNIPNCNTIPQGTFYDCSNLISIDAQNCKQIYANAFENCYNLTNINLQKCNYIAGNAFLNCSGLKSFNFENCTIIGNYAFSGCSMLEEADLTKCVGKIEERPLGDFVTLGIGSYAFKNCTNLKKIYLSNSNGIGIGAFVGCSNLNKVYIKADKSKPNYIIPLGNLAFQINSGNIRFYLGADIIEEYKIAPVWSGYKKYMVQFADQNQILYITNNNEAINIGNDKLNEYNCENAYINNTFGLITFTSGESIKELNQNFFKDSTTLTSIDLPLNCETIGEYEFKGCTSLTTYTPPSSNSLKEIQNHAFEGCTSLESFEIPNSIEKLGEGIFAGCSNIKNFKGNFVTYGGKAIVTDRIVEKQTSDGTVEEQKLRTLISVVAKDDSETNGRIYNISEIDPNIERLGEYCFSGCKELRRVDIPDTVTEIGKCAFEGCENLCEIHFYGNETIEKDLFYDNSDSDSDSDSDNNSNFNSNLKIFILQENFQTFIENNPVFAYEYKDYIYPKPSDNTIIYYTNNNDNIINDSDTKVDTEVSFTTYDDDINSLKYTYFITDIKKFTNNVDIQKVIIGENNKKINESAFKNCTSLEYVYIPNKITEFGNECFYGCEKLNSIIIPNKPNKFIYIEQPKEYTRSIDINNNIIFNAFLSEGNTKFGNDIFYGCKKLTKFDSYYKNFLSSDNRCYIDGNYLMFFAEGGISNYEFPSDIKVNTINKSAFKGTSIKSITICDTVSTIGESAFEGCAITSINGLDKVTTIQKNAFKNCTSLGEISLKNASTIGESAFEGSSMSVTNNDLSNVTKIGAGAFKLCKNFGYVEVDDKNKVVDVNKIVNLKNITSINDSTFWGCNNLNHICLSENITEIGNYAFYGCSALDGVYIVDDSVSNSNSSKLKSIGNYAFYMNSNLSKFNLHLLSNLTHIGNYAFAECTNYKYNLILPNSVESIGTNCFASSGIEKLTLNKESNLKKISQNAFTNCSNLASVDIKSTTTTIIGKESFLDCKILKTLNLSDTVEYINTSAFAGCEKIEFVYLPLNLIELGHLCFDTGGTINIFIKKQSDLNDDLSNLKICKFTNFTTRPFGETSFGAPMSSTTVLIHVPQHIFSNKTGIKDKYISNIYWSIYASRIYVYVKTQISDRNPILRPT